MGRLPLLVSVFRGGFSRLLLEVGAEIRSVGESQTFPDGIDRLLRRAQEIFRLVDPLHADVLVQRHPLDRLEQVSRIAQRKTDLVGDELRAEILVPEVFRNQFLDSQDLLRALSFRILLAILLENTINFLDLRYWRIFLLVKTK